MLLCYIEKANQAQENLHIHNQAPVVQTVENAIQWMRLYPLDKDITFPNTYPLDVVIYLLDSTIQHLNKQGRLV